MDVTSDQWKKTTSGQLLNLDEQLQIVMGLMRYAETLDDEDRELFCMTLRQLADEIGAPE